LSRIEREKETIDRGLLFFTILSYMMFYFA